VTGNPLRIVTTTLEAGAGAALLFAPSWSSEFLLGEGLTSPAALAVARIGGAALLSIAVACGLERQVAGLLVYNLAVPIVLVHARFASHLEGLGLWPACVLHAGLAVWCAFELRRPKNS
jgi:hypothetical protein